MKECKKINKDLVAFLYGELPDERQQFISSHLEECSSCQREREKLREVHEGADSLNEDIKAAMASVDWETLPAQITDTVFGKEVQEPKESWVLNISRVLFQPKLRPVYAALLIGVLLGALFTFILFRSPLQRQAREDFISYPPGFIEKVELEMARRETLDYLKKSQYLILDFVQTSAETAPSTWQRDFASQKVKDLLSKKKYINQQLDKFKMAKAKETCNQIEFLIYELVQISDEIPAWRLQEIHDFIEDKQLLLKIKLLEKELKQSEKSEV
jgi:hypothetical protein